MANALTDIAKASQFTQPDHWYRRATRSYLASAGAVNSNASNNSARRGKVGFDCVFMVVTSPVMIFRQSGIV